MLTYIAYKWDLYKARKELKKCQMPYDKELEKAKTEGGKEKLKEIWGERQGVCQIHEIEIEYVITKYLRSRANDLCIPLPQYHDEDYWHHEYGYHYILTDKGKYETTKKIRQELKERREPYIQILAILIGLIGALTGLFSVLK